MSGVRWWKRRRDREGGRESEREGLIEGDILRRRERQRERERWEGDEERERKKERKRRRRETNKRG